MILEIILAFNMHFSKDIRDFNIKFYAESRMPLVFNPPFSPRRANAYCLQEKRLKITDFGLEFKWVPGGEIVLNKNVWYNLNNWQKKELLYHELGHCYLNLAHVTEPERIMNPFSPRKFWVAKNGSNWNSLVKKMQNYYLKQKEKL